MTGKKPDLPPEVLNKLMRRDKPLLADLRGPGPFQLPLLTRVESILGPLDKGHLEIRLETESRQAVRIVLTEEAGAILNDLLRAHYSRQAELAGKKPKN